MYNTCNKDKFTQLAAPIDTIDRAVSFQSKYLYFVKVPSTHVIVDLTRSRMYLATIEKRNEKHYWIIFLH